MKLDYSKGITVLEIKRFKRCDDQGMKNLEQLKVSEYPRMEVLWGVLFSYSLIHLTKISNDLVTFLLQILTVTKKPAILYNKLLTVLLFLILQFSEAVVRRCTRKQVFLKLFQNSQKNTCIGVSVLIKLQVSRLELFEKETPVQVFS